MPSRPLVTIPEPTLDVLSIRATVLALKELAEVLGGQRGRSNMRAVTWADLINLGLATDAEQPAAPPVTPTPGPGPGGFASFTYTLGGANVAPPAMAEALFDDLDPEAATLLWLSAVNSTGINNINFFRIVTITKILVQESADPTRYIVYDAPGSQTVFADYVEIPIVWDSSGPDLPRPGEPIVVAMT